MKYKMKNKIKYNLIVFAIIGFSIRGSVADLLEGKYLLGITFLLLNILAIVLNWRQTLKYINIDDHC